MFTTCTLAIFTFATNRKPGLLFIGTALALASTPISHASGTIIGLGTLEARPLRSG